MPTIGDVLLNDPASHPLANSGQAHVADRGEVASDETRLRELKYELRTFVCEGQFEEGIRGILDSFLRNLAGTSQQGAWVSGFFGSGKSHLLKMLVHLWADTPLGNGETARSVADLPDAVADAFKELDSQAKRGGGTVAAAGTILNSNDHVRREVLKFLFRAAGLPPERPKARVVLDLQDRGLLDAVQKELGGDEGFAKAMSGPRLFVPSALHHAILAAAPDLAPDPGSLADRFRAEFEDKAQAQDLPTGDFLEDAKAALLFAAARAGDRSGKLPLTLLVLDEVQQWVSTSEDRSAHITDLIEALNKKMQSRVQVVAAGQSALSNTSQLKKLMDRCSIPVQLSDADVQTVTRRVLLQKRQTMLPSVRKVLDDHAGEIARQLADTGMAPRPGDEDHAADDYPLLPVRRRFWSECFRSLDATGNQSELRGQLKMLHTVLSDLSDRPLGAVIPADVLYTTLEQYLRDVKVLPREAADKIEAAARANTLDGRVCRMAFLMGRLPAAESGGLRGLRADAAQIADLLVDDLNKDNAAFRRQVEEALERLVTEGDRPLMRVDGQYRVQTQAGTQWNNRFETARRRLEGDSEEYRRLREQGLHEGVHKLLKSVQIYQGQAPALREFETHRGQDPPPARSGAAGRRIPLWIRNEGNQSEDEFAAAARAAGDESPLVLAFVPLPDDKALRQAVLDAEAAKRVLEARPDTGTEDHEERDARRALEDRLAKSQHARIKLLADAVGQTRVYQAGGRLVDGPTAEDRLQEAGEAAAVRLFPNFDDADHRDADWAKARTRAMQGADGPLKAIGHAGPTDQHPVCRQILSAVGAGAEGADLRETLEGPPYGWSRDAVDAALISLVASEDLAAEENGRPVDATFLNSKTIPKARFRRERITLKVKEKIDLRTLCKELGVGCESGAEAEGAVKLLDAFADLSRRAGGDPPLPSRPTDALLDELRGLAGNERLAQMHAKADTLRALHAEWTDRANRAEQRLDDWRRTGRFASYAEDLPDDPDSPAARALRELDAVKEHRSLLDPTDPLPPLRAALGKALRAAVTDAHERYAAAVAAATKEVEAAPGWVELSTEERTQALREARLEAPESPHVATDEALLAALDTASLATRRDWPDGVPARAQRLLGDLARRLEPKIQFVDLERPTLDDAPAVEAWLARTRTQLLKAVKDGPVLLR